MKLTKRCCHQPHRWAIHVLTMVSSAKIFRIPIQAFNGSAVVDWDSRTTKFTAYSRLLSEKLALAFTKFSRLSRYRIPQDLYRAKIAQLSNVQLQEMHSAMRSLLPSKTGWRHDIFPATPKMVGLGCFPLIPHLHARDLKWMSRLFTDGNSKRWIQLVWNIIHLVGDRIEPMSFDEITILPTPLRALLLHLQWDRFKGISPFVCEIEWLRPLWLQLKRGYYLRYCTDVDTAIAYVHIFPPPPRIIPQWQVGRTSSSLENFSVKLGTRILTAEAQSSRCERWHRWLEIIHDKRPSDSMPCSNDDRIPFVPLYKVLQPLIRLRIPSVYKVAFWETVMQTGMTSERLHRAWPCICPNGPDLTVSHGLHSCVRTRLSYPQCITNTFKIIFNFVPKQISGCPGLRLH